MRWVIKTGSAVLSRPEGGLDKGAVERIGLQLCELHRAGHEVILVSSGAIAAGVGRLGMTEKPKDLRLKQSAAAIGQLALMEAYEAVLSKKGVIAAQILLTREDLLDRQRYLNIRNTLTTLLSLKTIPIINENDTVSTDEIQFGDNDTLSAIVATKVEAGRLVLLSDVPGLYEFGLDVSQQNPIIPVVEKVTDEMVRKASKITGSKLSSGGVAAKISAAKVATSAGIETWIASGYRPDVLNAIDQGLPDAGTKFLAKKGKLASRHAWIAYGRRAKGVLVIDDGACRALTESGKSLLPKGIKSVRGSFSLGDMVVVRSARGVEVGRGLVNHGSNDLQLIKGHHTSEIPVLLGRSASAEVIHRDNFVLL